MASFFHSMTFNVLKDNAAAAAEFVKRLIAAGHKAELIVHDEETAAALAAHNDTHGNAPPAAVAHSAPVEIALAIAIAIEEEFGDKK